MICTEVGELMQRQLDHDLDEQELTLLMTHLSECIACKDLFEKLTLLSGSLEQLPRVTPSINIVDSILPELDAIDRQRSSETKKARYTRMRWMTATASVAAAAAVVFIMSIGWNGSNADKNMTYDVALAPESGASSSSDSAYDVMPMSKKSDGLMDRSINEQSGEGLFSIEPMSSPGAIAQYYMDTEAEQRVSNEAVMEQALPPSSAITSTIDPKNKISGDGKQGGFVHEDLNPTNQGATGTMNITEADEAGATEHGVADQQLEHQKNYSPDEQVYVVFEGHTIALYETSTNELIRSWEMSVAGTARLAVWDSENQSFIYEVTDEQGEHHSFTININEPNE